MPNSNFKKKKLDLPGIEPGAFRLRSERDTTTPQTHDVLLLIKSKQIDKAGPR